MDLPYKRAHFVFSTISPLRMEKRSKARALPYPGIEKLILTAKEPEWSKA